MTTPTVGELEQELLELEAKSGRGSLKRRLAALLDEMGVPNGSYYDGRDVLFVPTHFNGNTDENVMGVSFMFSDNEESLNHIRVLVGGKRERASLLARLKEGKQK